MNGSLVDIQPATIAPATQVDLITDRNVLAKKLQKPTKKHSVPSALQPLFVALGTFALLLLAFKAPIIINQIQYATAPPQVISTLPVAGSVIPPDSSISIPKINVHAPLVDISTRNEADVQKGLEGGVIHYSGTPEPGEAGNSVFFGHSSNDWWEPGNFKFVFVLLDKLGIGDQFTIDYQSKRYTYEVINTEVVEPNNLGVLAPTSTPTVTIITCTPPGTSWKRLVVTAKQTNPSPTGTATTPSSGNQTVKAALPTGTPGVLTQMGHAVSGVYHGILSLFGADQKPAATNSTDTLPTAK